MIHNPDGDTNKYEYKANESCLGKIEGKSRRS